MLRGGLAAKRRRLDNRAQIATLERQVASLVVAIAQRLAGMVSLARYPASS